MDWNMNISVVLSLKILKTVLKALHLLCFNDYLKAVGINSILGILVTVVFTGVNDVLGVFLLRYPSHFLRAFLDSL